MVPELLSHAELAVAIKSATDDKQIQMLLDQVSGRRKFLQLYPDRKNPVVLHLRRIASDFHYPSKAVELFVNTLKNAGIPIVPVDEKVKNGPQKGDRRHWIIAAQHNIRGRNALFRNPALEPFLKDLLIQLSGPPAERPAASRIIRNKGFMPLNPFFLEVGIGTIKNPRYTLDEIFTEECSIPIYNYRDRYSCPSDQADELRSFLQTRKHALERRELIDSVKKAAYG